MGSGTDKKELASFLEKRYGGQAALLYKGREAIKLALDLSALPKGAKVGITGFTCYVVYQAIVETGLTPIYIDIEKDNLNFSAKSLERYKDLKAIIVQNTLGDACDIEGILAFCRKNDIVLIEDLAHSIGVCYKNGKEAGTVGDFAALSFSQDKMVDAVSGGALIIRNNKFASGASRIKFNDLDSPVRMRDRFYPLFTFIIRKTYFLGIGKALHFFLKKMKMLSRPLPESDGIRYHNLTGWYAALISYKFKNLDRVLDHRKKIVGIYSGELRNNLNGLIRFPVLTENRSGLIKFLAGKKVFVSDIWYDAPIAPKRYLKATNYKGQCTNSENVSGQILNLPTHINVSEKDAYRIVSLIKTWQTIH